MLTRTNVYGLGAEASAEKTPEGTAADVVTVGASAFLGPAGGEAAANLLDIIGLGEDAEQSREARKDALLQFHENDHIAQMIRDKTAPLYGQVLPDDLFAGYYRELVHAVNGARGAIQEFKVSRGIAGLGRSLAEKRVDAVMWVGWAEAGLQGIVDAAMKNISAGRSDPTPQVSATVPAVPTPPAAPAPAVTPSAAAAAPAEGKGVASLWPLLLFFLFK